MKYKVPVLAISLGILFFFTACYFARNFNPGEVGLGKNTTGHLSRHNGILHSGVGNDIDTVVLNLKASRKESNNKTALWFGNSQIHAINYYKQGDYLALDYLLQKIDSGQLAVDVFQMSSPHLNMVEENIYLNHFHVEKAVPDILIIPLTYRCFHFVKIRDELKKLKGYTEAPKLINNPDVLTVFKHSIENDEQGKLASKRKTWQEQSEETLNSAFRANIPLYENRDNAKSYIEYFPKWLLHKMIDNKSEKSIVGNEDVVALNTLALQEILEYAVKNNIKVISYSVPHPHSPDYFFYDRGAYADFFKKMKEMVQKYPNVIYADFSKSVPVELWGLDNDGRRDTYHFKSEGHRILADSVFEKIKLLTSPPG